MGWYVSLMAKKSVAQFPSRGDTICELIIFHCGPCPSSRLCTMYITLNIVDPHYSQVHIFTAEISLWVGEDHESFHIWLLNWQCVTWALATQHSATLHNGVSKFRQDGDISQMLYWINARRDCVGRWGVSQTRQLVSWA